MGKPKIAITARSFDIHGEAYKKLNQYCDIVTINQTGNRLSENELIAAIQNADGTISGTEIFSKNVIESDPALKIISRIGVGIDNIDLDTCTRHSIKVCNTPEAPALAVAEHTLTLLLSTLKRIPQYYEQVRQGNFSISSGILLSGKTVGIIGFGRIGRQVAVLLSAMGCKILFYDPYIEEIPSVSWKKIPSLDMLVKKSDIISLHSSPPQTGTPIITQEILSNAKKGLIIINTARGSLIDEKALDAALESGLISAAGLDVVSHEPYSGPLLRHSTVIITPHVASNTIESRMHMEMEAVTNVVKFLGE